MSINIEYNEPPRCCQGESKNGRGNEYHQSEVLAVQCDQSIETSLIASLGKTLAKIHYLSLQSGVITVNESRLAPASRMVRYGVTPPIDRQFHMSYTNNNYHYQYILRYEQEIETEGSYYPSAEMRDVASIRGMDIRAGEERDTQHRSGHSLSKPQTTEEGG